MNSKSGKPGKMPAFPLYASDFLTDTREWTDAEVGMYCRLLFTEWVNGSIPSNPERLKLLVTSNQEDFNRAWDETIRYKFESNGHGRLINRRMEKVRKEVIEFKKERSESGKKGAKVRWQS